MARDLRELRADPRLRAVVLRVNSPGGSAFASDIIAGMLEITVLDRAFNDKA